ncbi:MAG: Ig-like domain-containing protein [Candidatus Saccharimonadales bacterium]
MSIQQYARLDETGTIQALEYEKENSMVGAARQFLDVVYRRRSVAVLAVVSVLICVAAVFGSLQRAEAEELEEVFTIAQIPDTQQEVFANNPLMTGRYNWLAANKDSLDLRYVAHSGDVVNWGVVDPQQFTIANNATNILDASGVPYAYAIGNHDTAAVQAGGSAAPGDVRSNLRNTTAFNQIFPVSRFKNVKATFEPGKVDNMYQTFRAGNVDWLVLTHEMWPRQAAVDWAKSVVAAHPYHNVILNTHANINASGEKPTSGNYGNLNAQQLWTQLYSQYPNIKAVLSSHYKGAYYLEETGVHGNKVAHIMTAYHHNDLNHIRLLQINTEEGTISSRVYAPNTRSVSFPAGYITDQHSNFVATNMQWIKPEQEPVPDPDPDPTPDPSDNEAPVVSLTSPENGVTTASKIVTLTADASDNVAVTKVEFYAGNQKIGEDDTVPYSFNWDTTQLPDQTYQLSAKAFDATNNSTQSSARTITFDAIFTLAVVPDTKQEVSANAIAQLNTRYQWLVSQRDQLDLRFVQHVGNLVNGGVADTSQYIRASGATTILDNSGIPYAQAVGVHDSAAVLANGSAAPGSVSTNLRNTTVFNQYFPANRFKNVAGRFETNKSDNMYQTFSAGGVDWLVITLETWPRQAAVTWARAVIAANQDRNVIINTSAYLASDGTLATTASFGSTSPTYLWQQLVSQYPNVKIVTSGYHTGSMHVPATGVNGNKVSQIHTAYKSSYENHVRLLEINTKTDSFQSRVYVSRDTRGTAPSYLTDNQAAFTSFGLNWVR